MCSPDLRWHSHQSSGLKKGLNISSFFSFLTYKRFAILLTLLMIADIITTQINLASGLVREANGFMGGIVQNDFLFIGVKTVGTILILLLCDTILKKDIKWGTRGLGIITTMYIFIIINNLYWIVKT